MNYQVFQPALPLRSLIDMYWLISGRLNQMEKVTLLPDGGINLVVNLGDEIQSTGFDRKIHHENIFLVGPMMKTDVQIVQNEVFLLGVRFYPGAFSYFYRHDSIDQSANLFHEFPRHDFPDLKKTILHFSTYLDQFFLDRLSPPKYSMLNCLSDIYQHIGSINIETLAKKHHTTQRQLERQFKQQIGLSPKKFVDLERFRKAFEILNTRSNQSLEAIAWSCGYYDHAHMTNDFKRFTGQPPTAFILSDFSKAIAS